MKLINVTLSHQDYNILETNCGVHEENFSGKSIMQNWEQ